MAAAGDQGAADEVDVAAHAARFERRRQLVEKLSDPAAILDPDMPFSAARVEVSRIRERAVRDERRRRVDRCFQMPVLALSPLPVSSARFIPSCAPSTGDHEPHDLAATANVTLLRRWDEFGRSRFRSSREIQSRVRCGI